MEGAEGQSADLDRPAYCRMGSGFLLGAWRFSNHCGFPLVLAVPQPILKID